MTTHRKRRRHTDPYQLLNSNQDYHDKQRVWGYTYYGWKRARIRERLNPTGSFYFVQVKDGREHILHRRHIRLRDNTRRGKDRPVIRYRSGWWKLRTVKK